MLENDLIVCDSLAPLSFLSKNGYYSVNGKTFRHKIHAMRESTKHDLGPESIKWIFNDDVYDSIDWRSPVESSLTELYRKRAQQLRNTYDYLILGFSGGGDSTNILDTFVLNNIHLDEVLVAWPRSQTSGKYKPCFSTDPTNFLSEWDYLIQPKLSWLRSTSPKTKITIMDPYTHLAKAEPDEDIIEITFLHTYVGYLRCKAIDDLLLQRQAKTNSLAYIIGVNPPSMARVQRHICVYFTDAPTSYASDIRPSGLIRNVEFFYWTPDMPEVTVAQAQALLKNLQTNPQYLDLLPMWHVDNTAGPHCDRSKDEFMRFWLKKILYPTYDFCNLQVAKHSSPIYKPEWHSWFYNNPDSNTILQPFESAISSMQNTIDPRFFIYQNQEIHDYYPYISKARYVGSL